MKKNSSNNPECPKCKKKVKREENTFFPFCSERCKMVDLGAWLDGKYAIEGSDSVSTEGDEGTRDGPE
ncbi:MAG: DNA gyrase inhibitor YacG [Nitrospinaceae bacterium]